MSGLNDGTLRMNHLIIGLGATGAQVLAELRRRLVLRHGQLHPEGFEVRQALISQDGADLRPEAPIWNVAGLSIRLPEDQMLLVQAPGRTPLESQSAAQIWLEGQTQAGRPEALTCHLVGHLGHPKESALLLALIPGLRKKCTGDEDEVRICGVVPAGATQADAPACRAVLRELQALMADEAAEAQPRARFDTGLLWHEAATAEAGSAQAHIASMAEFLYQRLHAGHRVDSADGQGLVGVGVQRIGPDIDTWQEHLGFEIALRALSELSTGDGADTARGAETPSTSAQTGVVLVDPEQRGRMVSGDPLHLKIASVVAAGSFESTWNEYAEHFHRLARQAPEADRLGQLTLLFDQALQSGFRGKGVEAYFQDATESEELVRFTEERLSDIQSELMQKWLGGQCSLRACEQTLQSMVSELHFYVDQLEQTVRQRLEVSEHHGLQVAGLTQSARQVASQPKGGFFGRKDHERELNTLLDNAVVLWRERALSMTQVVAGRFAQRQAERLITRLNALFHVFESIQQALESVHHEWRNRADEVNARRRSDQLRERLLTREALGRLDFKALTATWLGSFSQTFSLRAMASMTPASDLAQSLLRLSGQAAREFIAAQAAPSLIDSLAQRWMAHQAQQDQALQMIFSGVGVGEFPIDPACSPRWQLLMPAAELKASHLQTFVGALEKLFRLKGAMAEIGDWARIGCGGADMAMPSDQRLTLIGLVPLPHWGRPAQRASTAVIAVAPPAPAAIPAAPPPVPPAPPAPPSTSPAATASIHREEDSPAWIPQARCVLLLAEAAGLIRQGVDPVSGVSRLLWPLVDEDGFDLEPRVLGTDLPDALTHISQEDFEVLRQALLGPEVNARLHAADRQEAIRQSMRARIEAIRSAAPASELDAVSLAWSQAARAAMRFVRQEAML